MKVGKVRTFWQNRSTLFLHSANKHYPSSLFIQSSAFSNVRWHVIIFTWSILVPELFCLCVSLLFSKFFIIFSLHARHAELPTTPICSHIEEAVKRMTSWLFPFWRLNVPVWMGERIFAVHALFIRNWPTVLRHRALVSRCRIHGPIFGHWHSLNLCVFSKGKPRFPHGKTDPVSMTVTRWRPSQKRRAAGHNRQHVISRRLRVLLTCPEWLRLSLGLPSPAEAGLWQLTQGSRYGSHHARSLETSWWIGNKNCQILRRPHSKLCYM